MKTPAYDFAFDRASGAWRVIDLVKGDVARVNGVLQQNLDLDEADEMAALLNRIALRPSAEPGARGA